MTIQVDGTNTLNKGAELMLYAILQEIEREYPEATVIYNRFNEQTSYIKTNLNFKTRPYTLFLTSFLCKCKIPQVLRRLKIPFPFTSDFFPLKNIDLVLDASGYQFFDKGKYSKYWISLWEKYYCKLKKQRTKIIFLPQAFGPFITQEGMKITQILSQNANIIFARDVVSYDYLVNARVDKQKIKLYPDFTTLIEGIVPEKYKYLKGYVCIIPNKRIIDKGTMTQDNYLGLMCEIIETVLKKGNKAFLLNHEGKKDAVLCDLINRRMSEPIPIVDKLTALEVKGIISKSYLVISSRFHGVASALNSGVPCLATSWSHKYAELFKDFNQNDCLLDLTIFDRAIEKIEQYLSEQMHNEIVIELKEAKATMIEKNKNMWKVVWNTIG
jgi:colanic acid/amylovoran biosynthesis protein